VIHRFEPPTPTRPLRLLFASAFLATMVGCSSSTIVNGKVTYKGVAVSAGSITLVDSNGNVYSATLSSDGTFSIPAVPTGTVQVAVVGSNSTTGTKPPPAGRGKGGSSSVVGRDGTPSENPDTGPPPPPTPKASGPVLPQQFADPRTSGLTATIKAGQPVNIDLN